MSNEEPKLSQSMMNELNDVNNLLDRAISKAKDLEKNYRVFNSVSNSHNSETNEKNSDEDFDDLPKQENLRPSNWDSLKSIALQDSINSMEEDNVELARNTKEVRKVKGKKLKIDDNWEDDPF